MIYLDNGATSLHKPATVKQAMICALDNCANPGRGGYPASMAAARTVLRCREQAGKLFDCAPERVILTQNCTHGLNIAIHSLLKENARVVISGFEHNAVTRPLFHRRAQITVAGRKLFDWEDTLSRFEDALKQGQDLAVFTHMSNVFGYILPVEQMAELCRQYGVPFVVDAAQSAGSLPVSLRNWGADFIAMPGHKGLLGPQGTGLLLCGNDPKPLMQGGTGSLSASWEMPDFLPDRAEAGTVNVPGAAGLAAGMAYVQKQGIDRLHGAQTRQARRCVAGLTKLGWQVFAGDHQGGTVSFVPPLDCETLAEKLADQGVCVRAGLHCAPLAHDSAGTSNSGTVRVSFGHDASMEQTGAFLQAVSRLKI